MPATYTYPGVYIEEIPSGVRTITGVSTSDTAFIDFFARGPVDEPVRITSFGDFEREFGGLDRRSEGSYAIQQFFLNGGAIAWVVRVTADNAAVAALTLGAEYTGSPTLEVDAASPGEWGNHVEVAVDARTADPLTLFNLGVREVRTIDGRAQVVATESHRNLTMKKGSSRYAIDVVNQSSSLVRLKDVGLGAVPAATGNDVLVDPKDADFRKMTTPGQDGTAPGPTKLVGSQVAPKTGMYALDRIAPAVFNILCIPASAKLSDPQMSQVLSSAEAYCELKRAFLIIDIPEGVDDPAKMTQWMSQNDNLRHTNAAVYFPRIEIPDPLNESRPRNVGASGTMAGIYARVDAVRGVWKAPAGTDAPLRGARLARKINDKENGALNPLGINALRTFPIFGALPWGARTLKGADQQASEWKYIPIRRIALFIEESLYQALQWVVFEPNDEPLWAEVRLNIGAFMNSLFRQGAFQGKSPAEAYFVKCDKETTTQNDIDRGIVNILVGFAPLKPAEFVVIKIQQKAGQIQT
jgi:Bacteriophage tail sheath protein